MNTSSLKSFAPAVRRQLMEAVTRKLDYVLTADTPDLRAAAEQVKTLRKEADRDRSGLVERVAYTWFNRFAAIRFLDARGWHPFKARVLTPATPDETQPEVLKLMRTGSLPAELAPHTDLARLNDLLDGRLPSPDAQTEVYRHLILATCRFYHDLLPNIFDQLNDETEFLLPDDLLTATSVAEGFRTEISDEDCGDASHANVELLGWLYQFYISEKKDAVMARKSAVPTEDIPAVTQLFTPHWIVRYLVENSLGRLWLLNRPGSRLREHMPYYIEGKKTAPDGSPDERDFLKISKPEEIRLCDPAVGSAHMLTYAFDLLTLIYEEEGYAPTEIPALILRHNLHGLEICPRAAQLAELALVFKAREKSRRFFQPDHMVRPQIIELRDIRFEEGELKDYIQALGLGSLFNQPVLKLLHQFEEAKNFGSLIQPCLDEQAIADVRRAIEAKDLGGQLFLRETHLKVLRVLEQAEALTQRYHVVVANPPYLGNKGMNGDLKKLLAEGFPCSKADLYTAFIERIIINIPSGGYAGIMSPITWMFIGTYTKLRNVVLQRASFVSLVQPEYHSFFESAFVPICAFVLQIGNNEHRIGVFINLENHYGASLQEVKCLEAIADRNCEWRYEATTADFRKVPSTPILYWASKACMSVFENNPSLSEQVSARNGMTTGDNERFLRLWQEVGFTDIAFGRASTSEAAATGKRWFPHNKGGAFRKWYGNAEYVVDWFNDGKAIKDFRPKSTVRNPDCFFKASVSWSDINMKTISFRYYPEGFCFDAAVNSAFPKDRDHALSLLAITNNSFVFKMAPILNPTMHFKIGDFGSLPGLLRTDSRRNGDVEAMVDLSKADWDNFETSWDFRDQPLLRPGLKGATLEASWRNWEAQSTAAIRRMQELETENNRLFIAAYGLDGELQPEVPEAQITLARAEARRDMAAFLSYAVGCMMGRYSPDHPGLIVANAGDSLREFVEKVGKPLTDLTFAPDEDGIIPVLDGEWFEDDIVARAREFIKAAWGAATLDENVAWLEKALEKDLRKYFVRDFYKDHLQTYKKRPIYWLVCSPGGSFQALIYLHRYTRDTVNTVLNKYLREFIHKLDARINHLAHVEATTTNAREKTASRKEADKLRKAHKECQEWEREVVLPLAQQRIELDLDDGVKVNYQKFPGLLAKIPGFDKKEED